MQIDEQTQYTFEKQLKDASLRRTHVRQLIFETLHSAEEPMSIQNIASQASSAHFVSIYRSIDTLEKAGIVKKALQGFKNLYELSDTYRPHHHHATCEKCSKTAEIHDERIESLMNQLTIQAGLNPTKHHFEMYGICHECELPPENLTRHRTSNSH